jgi:type III pantothenate kinase
MIFAVNIENTIISLGMFDDDRMLFSASIATQLNNTAYEYAVCLKQILSLKQFDANSVTGSIIASVVPSLTQTMKDALSILWNGPVLVLSAGIKTGLNLKVHSGTLGADFVSAAVCAGKEYPLPCVIVSLATATTFAAIDRNGTFLGTSIAAGIKISCDALHSKAAQLPQISMDAPGNLIGTNTATSMKSGLIYGTACMLDGMCKRYQDILGEDTTFLATGPYTGQVIPYCTTSFIIDEHLVLKGLNYIYQKNQTNGKKQ